MLVPFPSGIGQLNHILSSLTHGWLSQLNILCVDSVADLLGSAMVILAIYNFGIGFIRFLRNISTILTLVPDSLVLLNDVTLVDLFLLLLAPSGVLNHWEHFYFSDLIMPIVHMDGTSMEIVRSQTKNLDYVLILHAVLFYLVGQSG